MTGKGVKTRRKTKDILPRGFKKARQKRSLIDCQLSVMFCVGYAVKEECKRWKSSLPLFLHIRLNSARRHSQGRRSASSRAAASPGLFHSRSGFEGFCSGIKHQFHFYSSTHAVSARKLYLRATDHRCTWWIDAPAACFQKRGRGRRSISRPVWSYCVNWQWHNTRLTHESLIVQLFKYIYFYWTFLFHFKFCRRHILGYRQRGWLYGDLFRKCLKKINQKTRKQRQMKF